LPTVTAAAAPVKSVSAAPAAAIASPEAVEVNTGADSDFQQWK
jgi:hypothetical protein